MNMKIYEKNAKITNKSRPQPPKNKEQTNFNSQTKKQKKVPAQIWAKRNILKKLTIQLKFNKNQTNQYKKIRTDIQSYLKHPQQNQLKKTTEIKPKANEIISPNNKSSMRKLSIAKAENSTKYTENFFASNLFSVNGIKSFHYKSVSFQGNNFINVSKAVMCQKNKEQKNSKPYSHRKLSFSERQTYQQISPKKRHQRSLSFCQNYQNFKDPIKQNKDPQILKVSSKKLHTTNSLNLVQQNQKQKFSIYSLKRTKNYDNAFGFSYQGRKSSFNQNKFKLKRPKSCIVKSKKPIQLMLTCQGWNIKNSARLQEEPFSTDFRL